MKSRGAGEESAVEASAGLRVPIGWVLGLIAAAGIAGVGVGWWLGRASNPAALALAASLAKQGLQAAPSRIEEESQDEEPGVSLDDPWRTALELASRVKALEALLAGMEGGDLAPRELVEGAIAQLSHDELHSVVSAATRLDEEELREIDDLPRFATRLAEIAMSGVVEAESEMEDANPVWFSTAPDRVDPASVSQLRFEPSTGRIYAIFPTDTFDGRKVMMKWFRTDRPQILLFQRYYISAGEDYNWVWLEKAEGWPKGEYQVDIYSGDEVMEPVARGWYTVD